MTPNELIAEARRNRVSDVCPIDLRPAPLAETLTLTLEVLLSLFDYEEERKSAAAVAARCIAGLAASAQDQAQGAHHVH